MKCIFYYYNELDTLALDYWGDNERKTYSYVFYTLKQAVKKFRKDNGLSYKHIKIINLYGDTRYGKYKGLEKIHRL